MEELHLGYRTELFSPFVHTLREIGRSEYEGVNPLTVIDMHYIKELDEKGFIDSLYR